MCLSPTADLNRASETNIKLSQPLTRHTILVLVKELKDFETTVWCRDLSNCELLLQNYLKELKHLPQHVIRYKRLNFPSSFVVENGNSISHNKLG